MAEAADMVRQIAELHRTAAKLYHVTRKGGVLYARLKETPTDRAAEHLEATARAFTSAQRFLSRAGLSAVFAKQWAGIYGTNYNPTSENAPLQKLKQQEENKQLPLPNKTTFNTMKQQNTTTAKQYEVTPRTGKFIAAIEALNNAEQAVYDAMTDMYGEDSGLFETIPFDAVKKAVGEYLYWGIAENIQDSKDGTITI